jgi:hypothetical protein
LSRSIGGELGMTMRKVLGLLAVVLLLSFQSASVIAQPSTAAQPGATQGQTAIEFSPAAAPGDVGAASTSGKVLSVGLQELSPWRLLR